LVDELKKKDITFTHVHAANSCGIAHTYGDAYFSMIRPGLILYGYIAHEGLRDYLHLKPVLSLKSRVTFTKKISVGKGVSYGRKFVANKATRIAVVPLGYSHGVPYALSENLDVLINGKRYPVVGNVCMDYTMVALDDDVSIGDEIVYLGQSGDACITAEEWARKANTIVYEIITGIATNRNNRCLFFALFL